MGTRSRIALQTAAGTLRSIFSQWDGYPSHHGPILLRYFDTPDKISALLDLGDIPTLQKSVDDCTPYGTGTGDDAATITHPDLTDLDRCATDCNAEYIYLFTDGRWQVCEPGGRWQDLYLAYITERLTT